VGRSAAPPAAAPPVQMPTGEALMAQVLAAVDGQTSISAKVRHRVDLLGQPLIGSGLYLQQGRGAERLLRFELKLQTPQQVSISQQICDGTYFWTHETLGEKTTLTRLDMTRLRRARPRGSLGTPPPNQAWLALGGLTKLLSQLEAEFKFATPTESRLDDVRVLTLVGTWKPAKLIEWLPDQKDAIEKGGPVDTTKLAVNLPDRVVVHVDYNDLFPYRLEYWRSPPKKDDLPGQAGRMMVVMELYEVQLGGAIDTASFAYKPADQEPVDGTPAYLERFGLEDSLPPGAGRALPPRR